MVEKIKANIDRLLFVSEFKKCSVLAKYIGISFSLSKPKIVHLRPFLSSLPFSKF